MNIHEKKVRHSRAAKAIGRTPKTLRNWLQRDGLVLFSEANEGWREYSPSDVALLALVNEITKYGPEVSTACTLAKSALAEKAIVMEASWTELQHVAAVFSATTWVIWHTDEGWQIKSVKPNERRRVSSRIEVEPGPVLTRVWRALEDEEEGEV